jgi:hypothetical protein
MKPTLECDRRFQPPSKGEDEGAEDKQNTARARTKTKTKTQDPKCNPHVNKKRMEGKRKRRLLSESYLPPILPEDNSSASQIAKQKHESKKRRKRGRKRGRKREEGKKEEQRRTPPTDGWMDG